MDLTDPKHLVTQMPKSPAMQDDASAAATPCVTTKGHLNISLPQTTSKTSPFPPTTNLVHNEFHAHLAEKAAAVF